MLCDRVLRHIDESPTDPAQQRIGVSLTWLECRSRAMKKTLPDGTILRIILPPAVRLAHRDVIYEDASRLIYVDLQPVALLTATTPDPAKLATVAYELGNLHLPIELSPAGVTTLADGPAIAVFRQHGLEPQEQTRRFNPLLLPNGVSFALATDFTIRRPAAW